MSTVTKTALPKINNIISGKQIPPLLQSYLPVLSPCTSQPIASVALSSAADVSAAIESSHAAFASWSSLTIKSRAAILLKFHSLVQAHRAELAALIVAENGKNLTEALADVAKGNETVEYACSLPQLAQGKTLQVSSAVSCTDQRTALGVVASIVPFNFPFMVPMWTLPIALVMGNTVVLKPSEKVPMTMYRTMELLKEAGLPDGVVNVVQGGREAVEAIIDHDLVRAVTFVGSSPIAKLISERCSKLHKRCTALGGAKNHLIALPDCHLEETARDIVVSSMGCAGQRCMAASVLLLVAAPGDHDHDHEKQRKLLEMVVEKARALEKGTGPGQLGPVIDEASYDKIHSYIQEAEASGAKILLDGRTWANPSSDSDNGGDIAGGKWVGPTIIHHSSKDDAAMKEEIFGPVLSIYNTSSWIEAIEIENSNPFGNAACVYTSNGGYADWFTSRFQAGMLGVNVGIPVPREPFSFGGLYGTRSKYGDMDITGDGGMEFFSHRIKVTKKWIVPDEDVLGFATAPGSGGGGVNGANGDMNGNGRSGAGGTAPVDQANFAGTM